MRYRDSHGKGIPIILLHGGGFTGPINWDKTMNIYPKSYILFFIEYRTSLCGSPYLWGAFYSMKALRSYFLRQ